MTAENRLGKGRKTSPKYEFIYRHPKVKRPEVVGTFSSMATDGSRKTFAVLRDKTTREVAPGSVRVVSQQNKEPRTGKRSPKVKRG